MTREMGNEPQRRSAYLAAITSDGKSINTHLRCDSCRYDLLGQYPDGVCSECGTPVSASLAVFLGQRSSATTRRLRMLAAVLAVLFVVGCPLSCLVQSELELMNTRYASGFSEDAFRQVTSGMTEAQVLTLLGEPFRRVPWHEGDPPQETWWYALPPRPSGGYHYDRRVIFSLDRKSVLYKLGGTRFEEVPYPTDGIFRSETFPGLWLDVAALLRRDLKTVLATLHGGVSTDEHSAFVERLRGDAASDQDE